MSEYWEPERKEKGEGGLDWVRGSTMKNEGAQASRHRAVHSRIVVL